MKNSMIIHVIAVVIATASIASGEASISGTVIPTHWQSSTYTWAQADFGIIADTSNIVDAQSHGVTVAGTIGTLPANTAYWLEVGLVPKSVYDSPDYGFLPYIFNKGVTIYTEYDGTSFEVGLLKEQSDPVAIYVYPVANDGSISFSFTLTPSGLAGGSGTLIVDGTAGTLGASATLAYPQDLTESYLVGMVWVDSGSLDSVTVSAEVLPQPTEVWVDDDYCATCGNDGHIWGYDAFANIQDGIDAVAGSTVYVAAGTYNENLVINKQLILQGAGSGSTIIDASGGNYGILLEAGGSSAAPADRQTIKDLKIINAALDGIRAYKSGGFNLDHVTLENLVITSNGAKGVELHNWTIVSDMKITNCELTNNIGQGLRTSSGTPLDGLLITDSSFNGNSYGIYFNTNTSNLTILRSTFNNSNGGYGGYMTEAGSLTGLTVEDCEFNGNVVGLMVWNTGDNSDITITGSSFQDNDKWGALIWGNTLTNVLIEDSTVMNNDGSGLGYYGIDFRAYGDVMTNVAVHNTVITGHTIGGGVKNRNAVDTAIVDATLNDWGDVSGPHHPTVWYYFGTVKITNPDGSGDAVTDYVLYSPWTGQEGGFVTGGGTIWSEAGDYELDPEAEGQASFGFTAKTKKGKNVPDGSTNFVFQAGGLHFHSSSYDWLVVTGSDYAIFKGTGTIDGLDGDFKFKLWASDGDPDTFRILIWEGTEEDPEVLVYDNGPGDAITGGSIVIHTEKGKK